MTCNVGKTDRIIRVILGIIALAAAFMNYVTGTWNIVLIVVGAVLLVTGIFRWCLLYRLFRINTAR